MALVGWLCKSVRKQAGFFLIFIYLFIFLNIYMYIYICNMETYIHIYMVVSTNVSNLKLMPLSI